MSMMNLGSLLLGVVTKSDGSGPSFLGWLVTGSFGLLAIIYAFLKWQRKTSLNWVKAAAKAKKKVWKNLKVPLSHHTWIDDFTYGGQPSACCVCLTSLVSPQTIGTKATSIPPLHRCSVCGVAAHSCCSPFAAKDSKCAAQAGSTHFLHHWSERWIELDENPEVSSFCYYCDEPCGIPLLGASPLWCCFWCQRLILVKCHAKMSKETGDVCDLGLLRRLIVSPLSVKEVDGVGGVLSSITEEIIASSVRGQMRRRHHRGKNGSNRSVLSEVPGSKMQDESGANMSLGYVLNGLVGLENACKAENDGCSLKSAGGLPFHKGSPCGVKKYALVDLPQDSQTTSGFYQYQEWCSVWTISS
ncbi:hypothetical protein AAC387_Pa07g0211 [Persea americana]